MSKRESRVLRRETRLETHLTRPERHERVIVETHMRHLLEWLQKHKC